MSPAASAHAARQGTRLAPRAPGPRPRRVSGPARPAGRPPGRPPGRPARAATPKAAPRTAAQATAPRGLALGVLDAVDGISTHRLLDRLIRGRLWIGLVTFALIGIVTLQLGLLKLNSGIGRSLESEARLQRENSSLSIENSELASGDRVEEQAKRLGMTLANEEDLRFLPSHPRSDAPHAAAALQNPVQHEVPASSATTEAQSAPSEAEAQPSAAGGAQAEEVTSPAPEGQVASSETTSGEAAATGAAATQGTSTAPSEGASADGGTQAAPTG